MSHLVSDPRDIHILKAYWVNHAIDQGVKDNQYGEISQVTNKRQTCVGVYGIDIHPDGSRFATCGADEKIKIWSMAPVIDVNTEVSQRVEKLLAVCQYDKTANTNANLSTFNNTIHCVKWSNNGRYLASGAADGVVTIWSLFGSNQTRNNTNSNGYGEDKHSKSKIENWSLTQQLTKHRDENSMSDVQDIVWSIDDGQLVSAGSDHNIIVWSQARQEGCFECVQIIKDAHDDIILGLAFDPIGNFLMSQSADGSAKIWTVHNNGYSLQKTLTAEFKKREHFIRKNANDDLTRLDVCQRPSFSPDGLHLLTSFGVTENNIFISPMYKRDNFENEYSFIGHSKPTTVSKWNPRIYQSSKGEIFHIAAVGGMDRKLSVWATNRKKPLIVFSEIGKESVLDVSWSRTGDVLMAATHDGNVMVYIFGKQVFGGQKLSIAQHSSYVNGVHGNLHSNVLKHVQSNINIKSEIKVFTQTKPVTHHSEEKQNELITNGDIDIKMECQSQISDYMPSDTCFAPQEQSESHSLGNCVDRIQFNAVPGRFINKHNTQNLISDIFDKDTHNGHSNGNSNNSNGFSPHPKIRKDSIRSQDSVRHLSEHNSPLLPSPSYRNDSHKNGKKKIKKSKGKKRLRNGAGTESKKKFKKRKLNKLTVEHSKSLILRFQFHTNKERFEYRIECKNDSNNNNNKCELKQYKVQNGSEILLFKTEIPSFINKCECNEKWTLCGSTEGELYCFDVNGMCVMPPIQFSEEIVFLYLSHFFESTGLRKENENIYLVIITSDCVLKQWKFENVTNQNRFEPRQILKTNVSALLLKKNVKIQNVFVTNDGSVLLTLTNEFVFMYKKAFDSWLRICDNKYELSNQRRNANNVHSNHNNNNNSHSSNEIGKLSLKFSDLMGLMNSNSNFNNSNVNNNGEMCQMHTISHLEQKLSSLCLFQNRENEFENIMQTYMEQLLNCLKFKTLGFTAINKMNKIFEFLLNWNESSANNNWCGSVQSQRNLLHSIIQSVNQRNNDSTHVYYDTVRQLTDRYAQALRPNPDDFL